MADPVRPLVWIAGVDVVAAAGLSILVGLSTRGSDLDTWIAVATVIMWVIIVGALALIWLGLLRRSRAARTPFVLAQAFALVVAWPLVNSDVGPDRAAGIALGIMAVVGLVLALRPAVRAALG